MDKQEFSQEELNKLAADKEFNQEVESDPQIEELMNARQIEEAEEDFEILIVLDGKCKIVGQEFPPPTMGVFSLLELINSPFLDPSDDTGIKLLDIERLLYVLKYREKAVSDIIEATRIKREIDRTAEIAKVSAEHYKVHVEALKENAASWKEFDMMVASFAEELGIYDQHNAIRAINQYLNACYHGFNMLPEHSRADKKKEGNMIMNG